MEVNLEVMPGLRRRMTVSVPGNDIESQVDKKLRAIAKTARIQGFRPGKAPFKVIKQRYGRRTEAEVMGDVVQSTCAEALSGEGVRPAGSPALQSQTMKGGNVFEYIVTFEVYPEIDVQGLDKIEVEKPKVEVTERNIDEMLETLRWQRVEWRRVERAARKQDRLFISFRGSIDGKGFDGGSAKAMPLVLGGGAMLSDFEDRLVGMKAGREKTFNVTFPADYQGRRAVAGKTARFAVTVDSVSAPVLPAVDAGFIKSFGVDEGGVERLREDIRRNMRREMEQAVMARVKNQIMEGLLKHNRVDLPAALVGEEVARLREAALNDIKRAGGRASAELPDSIFEETARRRVTLDLLVAELIKSHDIRPDEEKLNAEIRSIAATYEDAEAVGRAYRERAELKRSVEAMVMENQLVDALLAVVNVSEVEKDFYEVVSGRRGIKAGPAR